MSKQRNKPTAKTTLPIQIVLVLLTAIHNNNIPKVKDLPADVKQPIVLVSKQQQQLMSRTTNTKTIHSAKLAMLIAIKISLLIHLTM
jgi:hypothetical protein